MNQSALFIDLGGKGGIIYLSAVSAEDICRTCTSILLMMMIMMSVRRSFVMRGLTKKKNLFRTFCSSPLGLFTD